MVCQFQLTPAQGRTGFEETKDFPIQINSVIAGRYLIQEYLGSAAFSKAIACADLARGGQQVTIQFAAKRRFLHFPS